MAKILFGDGITDARGKTGGSVYTKNRYGAVRRRKVSPTQPRTSFQMAVRAHFATLTQGFRALTASQIAAWNAATANFAKTNVFKQAKHLTGHALYIALNRNLQTIGASLISDPPTPTGVDANLVLSGAASVGGGTMTATLDTTVTAGSTLVVEATPQLSAGKQPAKNNYRVIGTFAAAHAASLNIYAMWTAKFGGLTAIGSNIGVRVSNVNTTTGEKTPYNSTKIVVAA